ncbi:hypothetical protein BDR07DRAFT_1382356 [Suillus spraguei]|nr:hypothetical protein BDR07DRAFT_1382356 [Suillus spraguei]
MQQCEKLVGRAGWRKVKDVLHLYLLATHYDPNWYKAWHTWALANREVICHLESQKESMAANIPRLLMLRFKFGTHDDLSQSIASGFSIVEVDTEKSFLRSFPASKPQASIGGEI